MPMNNLPFIVAVDFDGTIVESRWPNIGPPRYEYIAELWRMMQANPDWRFILWTCRTGECLDNAVEFCKSLGLTFHAVNRNCDEVIADFGNDDARKIFANVYLDDAAFFENPTEICNKRYNWHAERKHNSKCGSEVSQ